jgi:hypothetical protein
MTKHVPSTRSARAALTLAVGLVTMAAWFGRSLASDHQDTPEVELAPRLDINDVYAFPGASPDRIALAVTTSSPLTPAQTASAVFEPDQLYQIKVDHDGDAVEDLVLQFTFRGTGAGQTVELRGPVAPAKPGTQTRLVDGPPVLSGPINTVLGSTSGIQLFAGTREDPFFIDLEQFFRIIPDRRPVQGPLSKIGPQPEASAFRDPGFDFLRGINALAIVIELPASMLLGGRTGMTDPALGIWATTSR